MSNFLYWMFHIHMYSLYYIYMLYPSILYYYVEDCIQQDLKDLSQRSKDLITAMMV